MKKTVLVLSLLTISISTVKAQKEVDASYRRSSVCLMLMDEAGMPKREVIKMYFHLRQ